MEAIIKAHNVQNSSWLMQDIKTFLFQNPDVDEQSWCYWCPQRQVLTVPEATRHSVGSFCINKQDIFKGMDFFLEGLSSIEGVILYLKGEYMKQNCVILVFPKLENTCWCIQGKPTAPLDPSMAEINIWCDWVFHESNEIVSRWCKDGPGNTGCIPNTIVA